MSVHQGQGLPMFTPAGVARGLRERTPESKPESKPARVPSVTVDLGSLAKGAVMVGEFLIRRAARRRARASELRAAAIDLAESFQGYLGAPDLMNREGCSREDAERCLESLEGEQFCRFLCFYQAERLYVFPAFLSRVWACDYCGSCFPVQRSSSQLEVCGCPNCGAAMKQTVAL